jgi:glycosyltransferase involved in cell wall biosynthesis
VQVRDSSDAPQLEQKRPLPRCEQTAQTTSGIDDSVMATTYMGVVTSAGQFAVNGPRKAMRIVMSNSSTRWGGVHRVTEILARGLQARGHEVMIFGFPGKMLEERIGGIAPFAPIVGGIDFNPPAIWRVNREMKRFKPDVALMLMKKDVTMTGVAAAARGIPVVVRHANQRPLGSTLYWRMLYGMMPKLHITNAQATKVTLLESSPWLESPGIRVIYNGIDPDVYDSTPPADLGLPTGSSAIGFIGSFEARKGVRELAVAWQRVASVMPAAHLILVGKGAMEGRMRELFGDAPRVHWLGYRQDVAGILKSLDVMVLPSYVEGAPNVVLEAMSAGTAIVATGVSGTPELVRDGIEARLIEPRNADAISASLIEVLSSLELRKGFAAAARERVESMFRLETMIDQYEDALGGVL